MKDIALDQTVQRETTNVVKDSSSVSDASPVINKIAASASRLAGQRMNVEKKAQEAADSLRLKDFQNRYDDSVMRAQEGVMREEGINIQTAYDNHSDELRLQGADLLKELPEHLRTKAQIHMQGSNRAFTKTYLSHGSKGYKKFQKQVYTTRAQQLSQQAVLFVGDAKVFNEKLKALGALVVGYSKIDGLDDELTQHQVMLTKSKVVLDGVEAIAVGGDYRQAKLFFEKNAKSLSTDHRVKAMAEVEKAKKKEMTKQAFNAAGSAASHFESNPREAKRILNSIKDPEAAKEAAIFFNQKISLEKNVRIEEKLQTQSEAFQSIRESGGQITPELINKAKEEDKQGLFEYADRVKNGELNQTTTEGKAKWAELLQESFDNETAFLAKTSQLNGYALAIGETDLDVLQKRRDAILSARGNSSANKDSESKINTTIDDVLTTYLNIYKGDDEYALAKARAYSIYQDVRNEYPDKTDFDIQQVVRARVRMMEPLQEEATVMGKVARFLIPFTEYTSIGLPHDLTMEEITEGIKTGEGLSVQDASPRTINRLKEDFKKQSEGQREPTDDELQAVYINMLKKVVGLRTRIK